MAPDSPQQMDGEMQHMTNFLHPFGCIKGDFKLWQVGDEPMALGLP